jgi:hypothetical protein
VPPPLSSRFWLELGADDPELDDEAGALDEETGGVVTGAAAGAAGVALGELAPEDNVDEVAAVRAAAIAGVGAAGAARGRTRLSSRITARCGG